MECWIKLDLLEARIRLYRRRACSSGCEFIRSIDEFEAAGLAQGIIVASLQGHAHPETHRMVAR